MQHTFAIQHVRLFDGYNLIPDSTILVRNGVIVAVNDNTELPADAETIDGTDKTLLPGLIDAHVHTFGPVLKQALIFSITTELDMFTDYHMVAEVKRSITCHRPTIVALSYTRNCRFTQNDVSPESVLTHKYQLCVRGRDDTTTQGG